MVVSFKIARIGSRYRHKPKREPPSVHEFNNDDEVHAPAQLSKSEAPTARKRSVEVTEDDCSVAENLDGAQVSFILNIFPDGYTIVNPSESNVGHQNAVHDDLEFLHPYDRRSESLITAIECGHLPVSFLDDIQCKYINGAVLCEVRDYRKESSVSAVTGSLTAAFPSITQVSLKMSLDNVVKDIHLISDNTWDYGQLLEAESRILYALQPKLCLDPTPNLDRLCKEPTSIKLNLDIRSKRLKRLKQVSTTENSDSSVRHLRQVTGQPDWVNLVDQNVGQSNMVATRPKSHAAENSYMRVEDSGRIMGQPDFVNQIDQNVGQSNMIATGPKNHAPVSTIPLVSHQSSHQFGVGNLLNMHIHANDINSSLNMSSVNDKRGNHCQVSSMANLNKRCWSTHVGLDGNQLIDNINARKYRLKYTQVKQPLTVQQINNRIFNQYNVEQESVKTENINNFEPKGLHHRVPQHVTRSNFHKAYWNNMGPNLGAGATSVPVIGETRSLIFTADESMQQAQMAANWRSNTLQKSPVISGFGSSSSVGNMIGSFTPSSPIDRSMQDRFSIIKMLTARFKLNCKENKLDEYKPTINFPTEQLKDVLFNDQNDDILKDETCEMPLSMSLMGGNINICKTRVLNFVQSEYPLPENGLLAIPKLHIRLILSERQSDGTVAMHHGELDGVDYLADERLLPTLPNTHMADLLGAQFCFLMLREGYQLAGDHLKPKPISMVQSTGGQPNTTPEDFNGWLQKILESDPSESVYEVAEPSIRGASHHNMHPQSIGLFPGVSTAMMNPRMLNYNNRDLQLQTQFLQQQGQPQIQRKMIIGHSIGSSNNNGMFGFLGFGMGGDRRAGTGVVSPVMSWNPVATKQGMGQSKTDGSGGFVGQSSNIGGLLGANRQIHPGFGSGLGSSGAAMLGFGTGINRASDINPMLRNVTAPPTLLSSLNPNQNQTRHMNQQQFQLIKQEPTTHLQAVLLPSQQAGSPSPSIGRPQVGHPPANSLSPQNLDFTLM